MKGEWPVLVIIGAIIIGIILPIQIQFVMSFIKPVKFLEACGMLYIVLLGYTIYSNISKRPNEP